jgi:hypothetical protein
MMAGRPTRTPQNPTGQFRTSGAEDLVLEASAVSPVWPNASAGIFARSRRRVVDQPRVKHFGPLVVATVAWWREIKLAHPPLAPNRASARSLARERRRRSACPKRQQT